MKNHRLGYQDDGFVGVDSCGDTPLEETLHLDRDDDEPIECPVCKKPLRVVWKVYVEVVE